MVEKLPVLTPYMNMNCVWHAESSHAREGLADTSVLPGAFRNLLPPNHIINSRAIVYADETTIRNYRLDISGT